MQQWRAMDDEATAYLAIERLQRSYADIATRQAWSEVADLATPDARFTFDTHSGTVIEINGPVEFGAFGDRMTERFSFYEYIPLNFVVTIGTDGTALGRSYSLEVAEEAETGDWNEFFGVYRDDYAIFEGTWRFARRHYQTYAATHGRSAHSLPLGRDIAARGSFGPQSPMEGLKDIRTACVVISSTRRARGLLRGACQSRQGRVPRRGFR